MKKRIFILACAIAALSSCTESYKARIQYKDGTIGVIKINDTTEVRRTDSVWVALYQSGSAISHDILKTPDDTIGKINLTGVQKGKVVGFVVHKDINF